MQLQVVIIEPYSNFKEKIRITKKYAMERIQVWDKLIYIEKFERVEKR